MGSSSWPPAGRFRWPPTRELRGAEVLGRVGGQVRGDQAAQFTGRRPAVGPRRAPRPGVAAAAASAPLPASGDRLRQAHQQGPGLQCRLGLSSGGSGDRGVVRPGEGLRAVHSWRLLGDVPGCPGGRGPVPVPGGVACLLQGGQLSRGGRAGDPGGLGQLSRGSAGGGRQRGHDGRCRAAGRRCGGRAGLACRRRVRGTVRHGTDGGGLRTACQPGVKATPARRMPLGAAGSAPTQHADRRRSETTRTNRANRQGWESLSSLALAATRCPRRR